MSIKYCLILLTLVSVVADTMLLPFYPQFFASAFDYHSPEHVGFYIAACSFTVMITFPLWAKIAKKIHELHIWIVTQVIAAALGLACYYADSLANFWLFSLTMLVFKASYLLIYPYVMRLEGDDGRLGMAGLFSILMHFGAIGGATVGGVVLEYFPARNVYLIMAASDLLQVAVCAYIIALQKVPFFQATAGGKLVSEDAVTSPDHTSKPLSSSRDQRTPRFILTLGLVSLFFYFSAFLIRPFFTLHWESVSRINHDLVTAFIYAIPAWVALVGLWLNHRQSKAGNHYSTIFSSFFIAFAGVAIQSAPNEFMIILGRCIYGWALFQVTVRLEVLLFDLSHQDDFAINFSKIHIFQNIGVLLASLSVGTIVSHQGLQLPFWCALAGLTATAILFYAFFKSSLDIKLFFMKGQESV